MLVRPPFPQVIDSTLIASIRACETKAFRMYVEDWKPKVESVHLIAGGAFARGLEVTRRTFWEEEKDADESLGAGLVALSEAYGDFVPPDYGSGAAKTKDRMLGALEYYFASFPLLRGENPFLVPDGRPVPLPGGAHAIEFSFNEPLDIMHPESGEPLTYCGRTDMIAQYADGIYVWDDKTTSSLGARWADQWALRSQFTGYVWAATRAGFRVNGVIANGVSILKTKYDHCRAPTARGQHEVDMWYHQIHKVLERFIKSWENGDYEYNLDESCTSYGGCPLVDVCKSPNPEEWLPMTFEKRHWDPITRTETKIEEAA